MKEKKNRTFAFGYWMTERQSEKLSDLLTEDILERYNYPEYYDPDIIEQFAKNNKLRR